VRGVAHFVLGRWISNCFTLDRDVEVCLRLLGISESHKAAVVGSDTQGVLGSFLGVNSRIN